MANAFLDHLATFGENDWLDAVETLIPEIHAVDRDAVRIWFRFYPLSLKRWLDAQPDRDEAIRGLALQGKFELKDDIDGSHHFLYGHRFWKGVKCSVTKEIEETKDTEPPLVEMIKRIGMRLAEKKGVERHLTNAIAAVGLATLNQVGLEAFTATDGDVAEPKGLMARSPDAIVEERGKDDSQGIFGFLKTIDKKYSIAFSSSDYSGKFPVVLDQEVTQAASKDRSKDWQSFDERCWDGPIPIECTAASCGTCWVGVIGGAEKLSEVGRRERRQTKVFGYNQPDDAKPVIRLACQTRASGNVTLVIPPWNGVFGKKVYDNLDHIELEPNTTSAKHLRETIDSALSGK